MLKSKEILDKLLNNENVSRWDIFKNRKQIRELINERLNRNKCQQD